VVNSHYWQEDLSALVDAVAPMRWKIFQVLKLDGEKDDASCVASASASASGSKTNKKPLKDVTPFLISTDQFQEYVDRHRASVADPTIMKIEDNCTMQSSYILVDERGYFLDCSTGGKLPTSSILDVGGPAALTELASSTGGGYDEAAFEQRDGNFFARMGGSEGATYYGDDGSGFSSCSDCGGGHSAGSDIGVIDLEDLARAR
jgi:radical S-adenosyl methionine domain-containing protein 2